MPTIHIADFDGRFVDVETYAPGDLFPGRNVIEAARREMERVDMEDIAKAVGVRIFGFDYAAEPDFPPAFEKRNNRHERRKAWKLSRRKK